ncbi:hypothetical protein Q3C01_40290 [Bradyrhizobium sp. UFLA05-109]
MQADNSTKSGTHFSDVWMAAQISRSVFLSPILRNAWRRLFGGAALDDGQPTSNARQYLGA